MNDIIGSRRVYNTQLEQNKVYKHGKMFGLMHNKLEARKCRAKRHFLMLKVLLIVGFPQDMGKSLWKCELA